MIKFLPFFCIFTPNVINHHNPLVFSAFKSSLVLTFYMLLLRNKRRNHIVHVDCCLSGTFLSD